MKAAVLTDNRCLQVEERPLPSLNGDDYIVRIWGTGLCNSDIFRAWDNGAYFYPIVLGHEMCGEIVSGGPVGNALQPGTKVVIFPLIPCKKCSACKEQRWAQCRQYSYYGSRCDGGFQEYLAVKSWNVVPVPGDDFSIAFSLCEPVAVAIHASRALPEEMEGKQVIVIGAGVIGLSIAIQCQSQGAIVSIVDRNEFKIKLANEAGIQGLLPEQISDSSSCFDYIIEATGAVSSFLHSLKLVKSNGTVVWVGNIHGDLKISKQEVSSLLRREITIKGVWNSVFRGGIRDDWGHALSFIQTQPIVKRFISHKIPIEELGSTIEHLYSLKTNHKRHDFLKVVVDRY
jgi:L-iditol 2-dehydrogenase